MMPRHQPSLEERVAELEQHDRRSLQRLDTIEKCLSTIASALRMLGEVVLRVAIGSSRRAQWVDAVRRIESVTERMTAERGPRR